MTTLSLRLSVKAKNWRMNDVASHGADAEPSLVRKKVLDRDRHTCRACGFKTGSWQEVHHVNDDQSDNRESNLVTVCSYRHMCQHIGLAGRNEEAVLIWLAEIAQAELHHIVRCVQVAQRWADTSSRSPRATTETMKSAVRVSEGANKVMAALRDREDEAESRIGTSDLPEIANIMLAMDDDVYERRGEFLHGFRMLPLGVREDNGGNEIEKIVDSWMEPGGAYVNLKPLAWMGLINSQMKKLA